MQWGDAERDLSLFLTKKNVSYDMCLKTSR